MISFALTVMMTASLTTNTSVRLLAQSTHAARSITMRHGRDGCRAYRHMMEKHNGVKPNFQMNVTGVYGKDTMLRQISKAIRIRRANPEKLMNNKSEWITQIMPQIVIE